MIPQMYGCEKNKLQKNAGQSIENVEILDIRHTCNINMSSRG